MNNVRKLTCIVCPKGCDLLVTFDDGKIVNIEGFTCKRGKDYAVAECTAPVRTVTSTVAVEGGGVVSVKTTRPVPKELVFDVMKEINQVVVSSDVKIGDAVIRCVCGTDADVVITSNR